ncbi:MAG: peroxiredoxin family protein, partial [Hyphomonas sp.]|nr:peroxiredoxin family protein [Hyphomonas sp.]
EAEKAALAAEQMRVGPVVGQPAPQVEVTGPDGPVSLTAIAGEQGTVAVFFRSADWCPFCKKQLKSLDAIAAPLAEAGWTLAGISYDSPQTLAGFSAKEGLHYSLYADAGSAAIDAFDLRNMDVMAGSRFDGIPHPAIVFVGADGVVKAVMREEGYKKRPEPEDVLAMAAALQPPAEDS